MSFQLVFFLEIHSAQSTAEGFIVIYVADFYMSLQILSVRILLQTFWTAKKLRIILVIPSHYQLQLIPKI